MQDVSLCYDLSLYLQVIFSYPDNLFFLFQRPWSVQYHVCKGL